jgi:hypothetical protein
MIDVTDADFAGFCAALAVFEWRATRSKEIIKQKLPVKQG